MTDYSRYHSPFAEDTPYARAVELVGRHRLEDGEVVLDIGCGYGAIAEPVASLGLTYVGLDVATDGLADLAARGFEVAEVDLSDDARLASRLCEVLAGRPLAAVTALDVIEHLTNGEAVLSSLRGLALDAACAPLVISIPNVTHLDLAAKLLLGRWDVTDVGLLDVTHVSLYSPARLDETFAAAGWREVDASDYLLERSDQHFPADAAPLAETPLRQLLDKVRRRAAPGATTNQFVRVYVPLRRPDPEADDDRDAGPVFLSVLLTAGGASADELADVFLCLAAQRSTDFEVLVLVGAGDEDTRTEVERLQRSYAGFAVASRMRVVEVPSERGPALALATALARGRYVTVLDARSAVTSTWVELFSRLATERPGTVVRAASARQLVERPAAPGTPGRRVGEPESTAGRRFVLAEHVFESPSPPGSYAFPRSCFVDLGLDFAVAVPGAVDEEILIEAAMCCGVHEAPTSVTSVRLRHVGEGPDGPGDDARRELAMRLDAGPLLLQPGAVGAFWEQRMAEHGARQEAAERNAALARAEAAEAALEVARGELEQATRALEELKRSTSWRLTAPLRAAVSQLRDRS